MTKKIFLFVFATFLLTSCKTKDQASQLNYMQNVEQIATDASINSSVSTIQKGDQIIIYITAKDMTVVKPFNQNYSSGEMSQYSIPNSNNPTQGQSQAVGPTYLVDSQNNIDFPILGKLNTEGKTIVMLKDELRDRLSEYVKNPTVSAKITNYKVTVLGEVNKPGQYSIPDGQTTILNAIALAGDLTMYGTREDVLLVRNENGEMMKQRINLRDGNFINSPFYQLKQGDVIYVSGNQTRDKTSRLDPNMPIYISVAGIVVTILALVFKQ